LKNASYLKKRHFIIYDSMIPFFRLIIVFIAAVIILLYGSGESSYPAIAVSIIIYLVCSVLILVFSGIRKRIAFNYPLVLPSADMLLLSICIFNTGGAKSPLYIFYAFFIIFFSVIYGLKKSIIASFTSIVFYSAAVLAADGTIGMELLLRIIFFLALSFFSGYIFGKINKYSFSMATRDSLTSLYNHQYFYSSLECILSESSRLKTPVSIAIIDVDNFKSINDKYGHLKGDQVLVKVSSIIKKNLRGDDIAARYGGDEIVLVLPSTDSNTALQVCHRIKDVFQEGFKKELDEEITLSIGIATFPYDGLTSLELFHAADMALYRAKNNGKNAVEYCSAS
jgi:diguanylate cyclase (GGDEF)-like protein